MDDVELIEPGAEVPGFESGEQQAPSDREAERWLVPDRPPADGDDDTDGEISDLPDELDHGAAFPPPRGGGNGGFAGGGSGDDSEGGGGFASSDPSASHNASCAPRARWARSEDRVIGGVGGGLADALGLDPLILRLGFVAVTVLSASGIPAYFAVWLLLRPDPYAPPVSRFRKAAGVVLGGFAIIGVLSNDGPILGGNVLLAALLIGVAFAIWGPRRIDGSVGNWRTSAETAQENLRGVVDSLRQATGNWGPGTSQTRAASDWVPRPRRVRRPPSPLGRFGLLAALIGAVVTYVFAGRDAQAATWAFSLAAAICGIAVIVGMFWGRSRWLVIPGLLAVGGAVAVEAINWAEAPWTSSGIDGFSQPSSVGEVRPSYRYGSIDYTLDLTRITDDVSTTVTGAVGEIVVRVPPTARVELTARVGVGNIEFPDEGTNNFGRHETQTTSFGPEGGNRIALDLSVGIGAITIFTTTSDPGAATDPIVEQPLPIPAIPSLPGAIGTEETTVSTPGSPLTGQNRPELVG